MLGRRDMESIHYLLRKRRAPLPPVEIANSPDLAHDFVAQRYAPDWLAFSRAAGPSTYVDKFGIVQTAADGVPRFHHDPTTRAFIGARREGSRINRIFPSANIVGASNWAGVNVSNAITGRGGDGPDGGSSATIVTTSGVGGMSRSALSVTNAQVTVASGWFRWLEGPSSLALVIGQAAFGGTGGDRTLVFDGATGAFVSKSAEITAYRLTRYNSGWWRAQAMFMPTASSTAQTIGFYANQSGTTFQVWGADMGASTVFDSHVPTTTTTATRAAETWAVTGAALTILQGAARSFLVEAFLDATPAGTTQLLAGAYAPLYITTAPLISSTHQSSGGVVITAGAPAIGSAFRACIAGDATGRTLASANGVTTAPTALTALASASLFPLGNGFLRRAAFWSRRISTGEAQEVVTI